MAQRDYNASVRFRPEVQRLLEMVDLAQYQSEIQRIAAQLLAAQSPDERYPAYLDLLAIDETIPGLGLHNVNEGHSGVYQIPHRPIFRGIQYVEMHLSSATPEWLARDIVEMACYHVEGSLKHRLNIEVPWSVGMILSRTPSHKLDAELTTVLWHLNLTVYNRAKHTIERIDLDSHLFSVADAIAVYLACRHISATLLKDMGITTRRGAPVF